MCRLDVLLFDARDGLRVHLLHVFEREAIPHVAVNLAAQVSARLALSLARIGPPLRSFAAREVLEMHRLRLQHRVRRRYVSVHGMFVSNMSTLRSTTVIAGGTAAALDAWHARPGALYVLALTLTHRVLGRATAELSSTCAVMREHRQQSRMRDAV